LVFSTAYAVKSKSYKQIITNLVGTMADTYENIFPKEATENKHIVEK